MNIGILTAGGVCPGVNNIIHTLTLYETSQGNRITGFNEGFRGLNNNIRIKLSRKKIEQGTAGSILRVSCDTVDLDKAREHINDIETKASKQILSVFPRLSSTIFMDWNLSDFKLLFRNLQNT